MKSGSIPHHNQNEGFTRQGCHGRVLDLRVLQLAANIEPYVKEWHAKYADQGFVVIAIHSPEFSYERPIDSVKKYIDEHEIQYAVPIDTDFVTWRNYRNRYWPTLYLIDKQGFIQYVKIGEGGYAETDRQIRRLLTENYSPSS